jgi:indoleamine 2,3-dioxygenase
MEKGISTLQLESFDISHERGFLPKEDPAYRFESLELAELGYLEFLGNNIPEMLSNHTLRKTLGNLEPIPIEVLERLPYREKVMAARIYAFLTSAYVHQLEEEKVNSIPRGLAIPFNYLSNVLGRNYPILSYDLYALNNWKRKDKSSRIEVENLETIQNFVRLEDEPWFILIHVEIEAKAGPAIASIGTLQDAIAKRDFELLKYALDNMHDSMAEMIETLGRMPEHNNPNLYAFTFRPYIQMFQNVKYEGVKEYSYGPTFRGETGAQSSVIPSLDAALGIKHQKTDLTDYVTDMRNYMPKKHREFIEAVEANERSKPIREFLMEDCSVGAIRRYNDVLDKLVEFRQKHLEFAVLYIFSKVKDKLGTGGTPFMKWLAQLRDETLAHKINV